jgi:Fic family protein
MSALEKFIHDEPRRTPTLIKAALAHVQFETIHPFLDGNGRVGRLLIALLLHYEKALSVPLLYLSLYFKTHRQQYYELLQRVRQEGVWEEWLSFFLTGVRDTAEAAARVPLRVTRLFEEDASRIQSLGRAGVTALRMHQHARKSVLFSIPAVAQALGISHQAASTAVNRLVELDILREVGERRRNRLFVYQAYLDILEEGTRLTGVAAHP